MRYVKINDDIIKNNPKFFISQSNGGYSLNQRKDSKTGSVIPNCTGMASGLFNLEHYIQTGQRNKAFEKAFIYQAENFWWQVTNPKGQLYGKLEYGPEVKKGGLMVWDATDGNGHTCYALTDEYTKNGMVYVDVIQSNSSGTGGKYYFETLKKSVRWSYSTAYTYLGCIYPPFDYNKFDVGETVLLNPNTYVNFKPKYREFGFDYYWKITSIDGDKVNLKCLGHPGFLRVNFYEISKAGSWYEF